MVKISNYEIAKGLLNDAIVEKVYPLSIVEEYQDGEIMLIILTIQLLLCFGIIVDLHLLMESVQKIGKMNYMSYLIFQQPDIIIG